ncbi:MAG TPA: PD-(D/E)XK nuclease family protein [Actinomycetota bacterium]|nr:PD-(D/E)XK nuclease family protein [Actinomycetota bacterium]
MDPTPAQQRTLDGLMARTAPRPLFAADLSERLRAWLLDQVSGFPLTDTLWLNKHRLNDHGRCEGLFVAGLLGEGPPFQHRPATATGLLAHKAIEIDVPRRRQDPVGRLVEVSVERLLVADERFAAFWHGLDPIEASEIGQEAERRVEQFRMSFPPLPKDWTPIVEFPVRQELGPVTLSGRVDLLLGTQDQDEPMRGRRLAIDLKTGRAWPEFPEDMRLYALLLTLRTGVPPFRVASVFLDSGEWQAEDVTEETLFHAARRVANTAEAAAKVLAGMQPELRPGGYCAWCPRAATCPALANVVTSDVM